MEEMPGNRTEGIFDAYVQVVQSGEVWQREFLYQHEEMDDWFRSTAAKTGDGSAVAFSNITEQKAMEAALQERNNGSAAILNKRSRVAHTDASGYSVAERTLV
ncbi:MAG: hypothetical protein R2867_10645 [Caldilineaceae bacterium]